MKPYPRIRKTVKWGGAALTVVLVGVWIGSKWFGVMGPVSSKCLCAVAAGFVNLHKNDDFIPEVMAAPWRMEASWTYPFYWWGVWDVRSFAYWQIQLPLWLFPMLMLGPTAAAWRLDILARRRARVGFCPKCSYERAGLAAGALCPECGSAAVIQSEK